MAFRALLPRSDSARFLTLGLMYDSVTWLRFLERNPKPLVKLPSGSRVKSSTEREEEEADMSGAGVLPKPANLPPCEGGRWSGLLWLSWPRREKYASLRVFWKGGSDEGCCEADDVDESERAGEAERDVVREDCFGRLVLRTHSRPSTRAVSCSS